MSSGPQEGAIQPELLGVLVGDSPQPDGGSIECIDAKAPVGPGVLDWRGMGRVWSSVIDYQ